MIECPKCGCNGVDLVGAGERGGRPWARYACGFCSAQFYVGARFGSPEEGVIEQPVKCPRCKSTRNRVTGTKTQGSYTRRQRNCDNCGHTFASYAPREAAT